jgi:hypothetical protein
VAKHLAPYRTYVVRCWQEQCDQPGVCIYRFSLEAPATGERLGFTRLEDLVHTLELALFQIQTPIATDESQRNDLNPSN